MRCPLDNPFLQRPSDRLWSVCLRPAALVSERLPPGGQALQESPANGCPFRRPRAAAVAGRRGLFCFLGRLASAMQPHGRIAVKGLSGIGMRTEGSSAAVPIRLQRQGRVNAEDGDVQARTRTPPALLHSFRFSVHAWPFLHGCAHHNVESHRQCRAVSDAFAYCGTGVW